MRSDLTDLHEAAHLTRCHFCLISLLKTALWLPLMTDQRITAGAAREWLSKSHAYRSWLRATPRPQRRAMQEFRPPMLSCSSLLTEMGCFVMALYNLLNAHSSPTHLGCNGIICSSKGPISQAHLSPRLFIINCVSTGECGNSIHGTVFAEKSRLGANGVAGTSQNGPIC